MVTTAIVMVLVGLGIGVLSGLLGVGGGTLMVPAFTLGFGLGPVAATGTSLFAIIPTSLSGALTHLRERTADWRIGLSMGLGGAMASPLGVSLAQISPEWLVLCAVVAVIAYSALTMLRKALRQPKASSDAAKASRSAKPSPSLEGASATASESAFPRFNGAMFAKSLFIGLFAGAAGGYVGLGGGFIMVPLMSSMLHFPMRLASGTSLMAILCIAIPGAVTQALYGSVDFMVGLLVACGSVPGAVIGAKMARRLNDRTLRLMFAGLLGVAALLMVVNQFV